MRTGSRSHSKHWMWWVVAISPALAASITPADRRAYASDEPRTGEILAAVAEGYLENREAFDSFFCKFRVTVGYAASMRDAIERGALEDAASAEGTWVVDSGSTRYELDLDDEVYARRFKRMEETGANSMSVPFPDMKFVAKGPLQLSYSASIGVATVGARDPKRGPMITPIDMGIMGFDEQWNPAERIRHALREGATCKLLTPAEGRHAGMIVVEVAKASRRANAKPKGTMILTFDPRRGYFPVEISLCAEGRPPHTSIFVTKLRECRNNRWFPERSVEIDRSGDGPRCAVREIVVTRLELDRPISIDELAVGIPSGVAINDGKTNGSQFVAGNDFQVNPSRLEAILALTKKATIEYRKQQEEESNSANADARLSSWTDARFWLLAANATVVVVLAFFVVMSRIRRRP